MPALLTMIFVLSLISLSFTTTTSAAASDAVMISAKTKRLVTKLLHRDIVLYNSNNSIENQAQRTLNTSIARFIYLSRKSSQTRGAQAHLHPAGSPAISPFGIFYVSFSVGQPPIQQLAVMDSGSSFTWVKCQPCERCSAKNYDPLKSFTYANFPCNSSLCSNDCSLFSDECTFKIEYVKGLDSQGTIATEQFRFETSDEGEIFVSDAAFGCSHETSDFKDEQFSGVFGLGTSFHSLFLLAKYGSKFSYCIGNLNDPEYRYNMLVLVEGEIFLLKVLVLRRKC